VRRPGSDDFIGDVVNYGVDLTGEVTAARDTAISFGVSEARRVEAVGWHALDGVEATLEVKGTTGRAEFIIPEVAIYGIAVLKAAVT